MPRIRSIKPEFCSSETIAALSIPCRLHFAMLWTYADDEGRGTDNPRLIKAALWPLDDDVTAVDVERWQAELESSGRVERYEAEGRRYFVVINFKEHQKPSKPNPSKLPPPPPQGCGPLPEGSGNGSVPLPDVNVSHVEKVQVTAPPGGLREDSGSPVGGLPSVVVVGGVREGLGVKHSVTAPLAQDSSPAAPATVCVLALVDPLPVDPDTPIPQTTWELFWERWPYKTHKAEARKAWNSLAGAGVRDMQILDGLDRWLAYWQAAGTDEQYIGYPANWLKKRKWAERPPAPTKPHATGRPRGVEYDAEMADFVRRHSVAEPDPFAAALEVTDGRR